MDVRGLSVPEYLAMVRLMDQDIRAKNKAARKQKAKSG